MRMSLTTDELPRLASPSSIAELSELMARAHAENRTVAVFGGGTAFDDHPPASTPGLLIDLTSIAEVADHSSDTIRAGAGTRISALNRFAAQSGREILADLPLDRIDAGATLGGMIATLATGPRCLRRPRMAETVLSVTIVAADGTIARTAHGLHPDLDDHDLRRLVTGSWDPSHHRRGRNQSDSATRNAEVRMDSRHRGGRRPPRRSPRPRCGQHRTPTRFTGGDSGSHRRGDRRSRGRGGPPRGLGSRGDPVWGTGMVGEQSATGRDHRSVRGTEFHSDPHRCRRPTETTIGYPLQLRGSATGSFELGVGAPESEPGVATRVVLEHLRSFGLHFIAARLIHAPAPVWDEVDAWGPQPGRQGLHELKALVDPRGILAPGRGIAGV